MKLRSCIINLRGILMLFMVLLSSSVLSQTYTISPSGWTSVPTTNITSGSITMQGNLIQVKATIIGKSLTFNIKKKDDSIFQNAITVQVRQNSATGTVLNSSEYGGGYTLIAHGYGDITFTGSKKFVIVLKSKGANADYWYYSNPITVTVEENQSAVPTVITRDAINITSAEATLRGTVYPNGKQSTYYFKYGTSRNSLSRSTSKNTFSDTEGSFPVNENILNLSPSTTYYFRAVAYNADGEGEGDIMSFTTEAAGNENHLPSKPSSPSPSNGATSQPSAGTLSWSCYDEDGDDVIYNVYLGTSSSNMSHYLTTWDTYCDYSLDAGKTYYWYVTARDDYGSTTGNTWSFTTGSSSSGANELENAVAYLFSKGVIEGSTVSAADTDGSLLRKHIAKMAFLGVYKGASKVPSTIAPDYFPTVYDDLSVETPSNSYYYRAARALLYLEYGDGVAPFDRNRLMFEPDNTIQRISVLKLLMETFNIKPDVTGNNNPYPQDNDVVSIMSRHPYMMGYIREAAQQGIINDQIARWKPYDSCTRGDAMLMLYRIMQKVDAGTISPNPNTGYFQPLNTTLKTISLGAGLQMGNFQHYTKTSFAIGGVAPLAFAHTYNSYNTTLPEVFYGNTGSREAYLPLGDGWSHNYHTFITAVEGKYIVHWGGGKIDVYNTSDYSPVSIGVYDQLSSSGTTLVIKTKAQMSYYFGTKGNGVAYLSKVLDRNNNKVEIAYETGTDGTPRIAAVTSSDVSGSGSRSLTFSYKADTDLLSEVKDPLGRSISFSYTYNRYTGRYQLKSFTDAMGHRTTYEYVDDTKESTSKLLARIKLPKGNYITNTYDENNRRLTQTEDGTTRTSVSVTPSYGSSVSTSSRVDITRNGYDQSYYYQFNGNNMATSITGPEQLSITKTYYSGDRQCHLPKSITTKSTNISNITYDGNGNVTSVTESGDGQTLTSYYEYDSKNNLTKATDPKGNIVTYSYDSKGNLTGVSAPEGVSATITLNANGLPRVVTSPMNVKTEYEYDDYGNLRKALLPALNLSASATYDKASRMLTSTDALGRTTSYAYYDSDNLKTETRPGNIKTSFDYDANDNLTGITNANGGVTSMSYDNVTDWLTEVSFGGATKRYSYNDDGSLDTYTKSDGTRLSYEYDNLGRVTSDGVNDYEYDSKLRLESVSGNGKTISFGYDGFNRVTSTSSNGQSNSYGYDKNGNCTSINGTSYDYDGLNRLKSLKFNSKTITYTYRKDSQLEKVTYPNGMTTTYGYDAVGRLTSKTTKLGNGTVIAGYSYTLDNVGNIVSQTAQEPYGDILLDNKDVSYAYNSANRITRAGSVSYDFDDNGNTVKCGSERYEWDKSDRLTKAGSVNITYDPLGNIMSYGNITFTVDPLGIGNVLSDSKSGATYIYGNGLEARVKNGAISYYVTDMRGSVVAIVDAGGNITHKYQYDEFGNVLQKEEADYNPFQYVGKYGVMYLTDHLYYMRARHYDPTIGRFLSEDPIWSTNLYPYAENNPIMKIDPRGLTPEDEARLAEINTEIEKLNEKMDFIYMFSKKEEYKGLQDQTKESLRTQYNESHIKWEKLTLEKYQLYAKIAKESARKLHGHTINLSYGKPSSNEKKTVNEGKTGRISISEKGLSESFPYDTSNMDNSALLDKLVNANKKGVANGMGILQDL